MTPQQSFYGQNARPEKPETGEGFQGILGTRRLKPAARQVIRRNRKLINADA
jgi:hypothetical protein